MGSKWVGGSLAVVVLAAGACLPAQAAEKGADEVRATEQTEKEEGTPVPNRYRIGLACSLVPPVVTAQLQLPDETGLVVDSVLDESPAAAAGLRRYDVIVEADGAPLASVQDLIRAVNEAGQDPLNLKVIREGRETEVPVAPEPRPEEDELEWEPGRGPGAEAWQRFDRLPPEMRQYLRQFGTGPVRPGRGVPGFRFRQFRPGIVLDDEDQERFELDVAPEWPQGLSLRIEKPDQGTVRIHVELGDQSWEVTADDLEPLPEELRDVVRGMLSGGRGDFPGIRPRRPFPGRPYGAGVPSGPLLEERFEELSSRLDQLQEAIDSLRADRDNNGAQE
jgi:hypothetical protein